MTSGSGSPDVSSCAATNSTVGTQKYRRQNRRQIVREHILYSKRTHSIVREHKSTGDKTGDKDTSQYCRHPERERERERERDADTRQDCRHPYQ